MLPRRCVFFVVFLHILVFVLGVMSYSDVVIGSCVKLQLDDDGWSSIIDEEMVRKIHDS